MLIIISPQTIPEHLEWDNMVDKITEQEEIAVPSIPILDSTLERKASVFTPQSPLQDDEVFYAVLHTPHNIKSTPSTSYTNYDILPHSRFYDTSAGLERFFSSAMLGIQIPIAGTNGTAIRLQLRSEQPDGSFVNIFTEYDVSKFTRTLSIYYTLKNEILIPNKTMAIRLDYRSNDGSLVQIAAFSLFLKQNKRRIFGVVDTQIR